jgi:hypothetical protein
METESGRLTGLPFVREPEVVEWLAEGPLSHNTKPRQRLRNVFGSPTVLKQRMENPALRLAVGPDQVSHF